MPEAAAVEPGRSTVLVTRPEPGAGETAARVTALGLEPLLCPVLEVRTLSVALPPASELAGVLVTSGNALAALPAVYHQTLLFTVGNATADRARRLGFARVTSADGDSVALAATVRARLAPAAGPLLLAVGQGHGQPLASALRQAGYRVLRRVVYATGPSRTLTPEAISALQGRHVRSALFFSAETARQFVRLARQAELDTSLRDVDAVAIGRPAAVALETLPWRRVRVAARPNQDEMLVLL